MTRHLDPGPFSVRLVLLLLLAALPSACQPGPEPAPEAKAPAPRLLEELGGQTHPIGTSSPRAQRFFDQGLILTFGFNHDAAIRSFEEAARLDPSCAMCRWGIALALGPNINAPMGPEAASRAYIEAQAALELSARSSDARERAYIEALTTRYTAPNPADRSGLDRAYADAMREVHLADPEDVDAATLFAEALMDLYPWAYWTEDREPREFTQEIVDTLEAVLARAPDHVGANHYYIHAVEEYFPEKAEPAADRLGSLAPDAGHLVHMPSHIYWRVGRYDDAARINQRAAEADERFFTWCRPGTFYRALYYPHNIHFLWAAAAAEGRSELALMSARRLEATTRPGVGEMPFLQEFMSIPMLTLARFGRWDPLLAEPRPDEGHVFLIGVWHYTRGLAQVGTGSPDAATGSLQALRETRARPEAAELVLAGGTATASRLLEIAIAHLEGEIARADGRSQDAIAALERATALHDGLAYMEPPPWYAPPRQVLGALLLDSGRADEAEAVYREDLRQYPKNGWSLLGLEQSLRAQGQASKAAWARQGFEAAWARADVELTRSHL